MTAPDLILAPLDDGKDSATQISRELAMFDLAWLDNTDDSAGASSLAPSATDTPTPLSTACLASPTSCAPSSRLSPRFSNSVATGNLPSRSPRNHRLQTPSSGASDAGKHEDISTPRQVHRMSYMTPKHVRHETSRAPLSSTLDEDRVRLLRAAAQLPNTPHLDDDITGGLGLGLGMVPDELLVATHVASVSASAAAASAASTGRDDERPAPVLPVCDLCSADIGWSQAELQMDGGTNARRVPPSVDLWKFLQRERHSSEPEAPVVPSVVVKVLGCSLHASCARRCIKEQLLVPGERLHMRSDDARIRLSEPETALVLDGLTQTSTPIAPQLENTACVSRASATTTGTRTIKREESGTGFTQLNQTSGVRRGDAAMGQSSNGCDISESPLELPKAAVLPGAGAAAVRVSLPHIQAHHLRQQLARGRKSSAGDDIEMKTPQAAGSNSLHLSPSMSPQSSLAVSPADMQVGGARNGGTTAPDSRQVSSSGIVDPATTNATTHAQTTIVSSTPLKLQPDGQTDMSWTPVVASMHDHMHGEADAASHHRLQSAHLSPQSIMCAPRSVASANQSCAVSCASLSPQNLSLNLAAKQSLLHCRVLGDDNAAGSASNTKKTTTDGNGAVSSRVPAGANLGGAAGSESGNRIVCPSGKDVLSVLNSLPAWLRADSADNMLRLVHVPQNADHRGALLNRPQVYRRRPATTSPVHTESEDFCHASLNVSSGVSEWAAVVNPKHQQRLQQALSTKCSTDTRAVGPGTCNSSSNSSSSSASRHKGSPGSSFSDASPSAAKCDLTSWVPDVGFCLRHGVQVVVAEQRQWDVAVFSPGCLHWVFARPSAPSPTTSGAEVELAMKRPAASTWWTEQPGEQQSDSPIEHVRIDWTFALAQHGHLATAIQRYDASIARKQRNDALLPVNALLFELVNLLVRLDGNRASLSHGDGDDSALAMMSTQRNKLVIAMNDAGKPRVVRVVPRTKPDAVVMDATTPVVSSEESVEHCATAAGSEETPGQARAGNDEEAVSKSGQKRKGTSDSQSPGIHLSAGLGNVNVGQDVSARAESSLRTLELAVSRCRAQLRREEGVLRCLQSLGCLDDMLEVEPKNSAVTHCEMPNCRREILMHYFFCNVCNESSSAMDACGAPTPCSSVTQAATTQAPAPTQTAKPPHTGGGKGKRPRIRTDNNNNSKMDGGNTGNKSAARVLAREAAERTTMTTTKKNKKIKIAIATSDGVARVVRASSDLMDRKLVFGGVGGGNRGGVGRATVKSETGQPSLGVGATPPVNAMASAENTDDGNIDKQTVATTIASKATKQLYADNTKPTATPVQPPPTEPSLTTEAASVNSSGVAENLSTSLGVTQTTSQTLTSASASIGQSTSAVQASSPRIASTWGAGKAAATPDTNKKGTYSKLKQQRNRTKSAAALAAESDYVYTGATPGASSRKRMLNADGSVTTSAQRKCREPVPDWLALGNTVCVADTGMRAVVTASGHGFFTLVLEQTGETVLKRRKGLCCVNGEFDGVGDGGASAAIVAAMYRKSSTPAVSNRRLSSAGTGTGTRGGKRGKTGGRGNAAAAASASASASAASANSAAVAGSTGRKKGVARSTNNNKGKRRPSQETTTEQHGSEVLDNDALADLLRACNAGRRLDVEALRKGFGSTSDASAAAAAVDLWSLIANFSKEPLVGGADGDGDAVDNGQRAGRVEEDEQDEGQDNDALPVRRMTLPGRVRPAVLCFECWTDHIGRSPEHQMGVSCFQKVSLTKMQELVWKGEALLAATRRRVVALRRKMDVMAGVPESRRPLLFGGQHAQGYVHPMLAIDAIVRPLSEIESAALLAVPRFFRMRHTTTAAHYASSYGFAESEMNSTVCAGGNTHHTEVAEDAGGVMVKMETAGETESVATYDVEDAYDTTAHDGSDDAAIVSLTFTHQQTPSTLRKANAGEQQTSATQQLAGFDLSTAMATEIDVERGVSPVAGGAADVVGPGKGRGGKGVNAGKGKENGNTSSGKNRKSRGKVSHHPCMKNASLFPATPGALSPFVRLDATSKLWSTAFLDRTGLAGFDALVELESVLDQDAPLVGGGGSGDNTRNKERRAGDDDDGDGDDNTDSEMVA